MKSFLLIFLAILTYYPLKAQLANQTMVKGKQVGTVANPNVCIVPTPPAPFVPIPYVSEQVTHTKKSAKDGALKIKMKGKNLEKYSNFDVFINGRKTSKIKATISPVEKGETGVTSRTITLYLYEELDPKKYYNIQYRNTFKSKNIFEQTYSVVNMRL